MDTSLMLLAISFVGCALTAFGFGYVFGQRKQTAKAAVAFAVILLVWAIAAVVALR